MNLITIWRIPSFFSYDFQLCWEQVSKFCHTLVIQGYCFIRLIIVSCWDDCCSLLLFRSKWIIIFRIMLQKRVLTMIDTSTRFWGFKLFQFLRFVMLYSSFLNLNSIIVYNICTLITISSWSVINLLVYSALIHHFSQQIQPMRGVIRPFDPCLRVYMMLFLL